MRYVEYQDIRTSCRETLVCFQNRVTLDVMLVATDLRFRLTSFPDVDLPALITGSIPEASPPDLLDREN